MDVRFETKYGNKAGTHEWLTPRWIIEKLGPFELDPCYSLPHPWETATHYYTKEDNGLLQPWYGFVWCNPPYGEHTEKWLARMSEHRRCIGLIFARTETKMFRQYIWDKAVGVLFLYGRLKFYRPDGTAASMTAGAPSCLIAWDEEGYRRLLRIDGAHGKLVRIR